MVKVFSLVALLFYLYSCNNEASKLPILGDPEILNGDSIYPKIPEFEFVNQDSIVINHSTFNDKIYIADFIFLNCPTICPVMTIEMKKVYKHYASNDKVKFLSHTIDPENDSIPRLKRYSKNLAVDSNKWHFVTGEMEEIYSIAKNHYFISADQDNSAPGGFLHSGALLLIDENKYIRGVYDGTNPLETDRLIKDISVLLNSKNSL